MEAKRARGIARNARIREVATTLFLKKGYESVTLDEIVRVAGGSKSAIYSEFGSKSKLFISIIEALCQQVNESLGQLDLQGLDLRGSLEELGFQIMKLISVRRAFQLHRIAVGESGKIPQVGRAWYRYGPARTIEHIRVVLEEHREELPEAGRFTEGMATALHDAFIGNTLSTLISGVDKPASEEVLRQRASFIVSLFLPE